MPETIDGLPLHPLIVHLPVVFGPILGLLALGLLHPGWREPLIRPLAAFAVVVAVMAVMAAQSGEWLAENLAGGPPPGLHDHEEAAELYRNVAIIFALLLIGMAVAIDRLALGLQTVAAVVLAIIGLASVGAVVRAGHEGAKLAWDGRVQEQ